MGIVTRIMKGFSRRDLSITNPKAWDRTLWNLVGSKSLSGESVDEYSALTYSAVYNAISLISGTVGSLPLHLFRQTGKNKTFADDKGLFYVMGTKPNPYMTSMALREVMTAHILAWGNAYAEKVRNVLGDIVELWPIPPDRVNVKMEGTELVYKIKVDNLEKTFTRDKILHIPGLGFDGFVGYSVIAMARKSIGLGMAIETFGSLYFGQGTHPGLVVSHPGTLKDPSKMRDALGGVYSGLGKTHLLMLLEEGMKVEKIGIPPNDSQFLESRVFQISEIARWFNLNLHKLKEMERSTNNNIESEQISYLVDCILPWLIRFEQNYNMQLLTENEQRIEKFYFKHNVEGLLRGDRVARGNFYRAMFNIAGMSPNEIRAKEDMDPSDAEFADDYFVPLNMVPISMIREMLEKGIQNIPGKQPENLPEGSQNEPK